MIRYFLRLIILVTLLISWTGSIHLSAQRLAATDRHASLICNDGNVYSWGYNMDALLGDGTTELRKSAVKVVGLSNVVSLACGEACTFAVTADGDVYTWGSIDQRRVGVPSFNYVETVPARIKHVSSVSRVAVGGDMVYYLEYGQLSRVSGANYYGEYGNGLMVGLDSGSTAVNVSGLVRVFAAALTGYGIVESGKLYGWGNNFAGLIDTTLSDRIAVPVGMLPEIRFREGCVTYGYENSGSVRFASDSGHVYVWGSNKHGQLGLSDAYIKAPTKINLPMPCIALAGGTMHTIALLKDGTVWSWGDNAKGQLGNPFLGSPYATSSITPVKAIGLNDVVEIAAAGTSSYAITRDGTLYGWGDNTYRQLNRDDAPRQYTPVPLPLPCALVSDVKESRSQESIVVSPNPVRDHLTISTPTVGMSMPFVVSVYSVHGEQLLTVHFEVTDRLGVDVRGLAAGTYHVVVSNGNVRLHSTFVKLP